MEELPKDYTIPYAVPGATCEKQVHHEKLLSDPGIVTLSTRCKNIYDITIFRRKKTQGNKNLK